MKRATNIAIQVPKPIAEISEKGFRICSNCDHRIETHRNLFKAH